MVCRRGFSLCVTKFHWYLWKFTHIKVDVCFCDCSTALTVWQKYLLLLRQQLKCLLKLPLAEERRAVNNDSTTARYERQSVQNVFICCVFGFFLSMMTSTVTVIHPYCVNRTEKWSESKWKSSPFCHRGAASVWFLWSVLLRILWPIAFCDFEMELCCRYSRNIFTNCILTAVTKMGQ